MGNESNSNSVLVVNNSHVVRYVIKRLTKMKKHFLIISTSFIILGACSGINSNLTKGNNSKNITSDSLSIISIIKDIHPFDTIIFFDNYYEIYRLQAGQSMSPYNYKVERFMYSKNSDNDSNYSITRRYQFNEICYECGLEYHLFDSSDIKDFKEDKAFSLKKVDTSSDRFLFNFDGANLNRHYQEYLLFEPIVEECFWERECYSDIKFNYLVKEFDNNCQIKNQEILINDTSEFVNGFTGFGLKFPLFEQNEKKFQLGYFIAAFSRKENYSINHKEENIWVDYSYTFFILKKTTNNL